MLFDLPLRWQWLVTSELVCVASGALLVLRPRLTARDVAQRLDRRFQLHEQMATALELDPNPTGVEAYLFDASQHSLSQIRHATQRQQIVPWAEVGLTLALCVLLGGLVVLTTGNPSDQFALAKPIPSLVPASNPTTYPPTSAFGTPAGSMSESSTSETSASRGDPLAIQALAQALRDQSLTRPVAESLDEGDVTGAAQQLRELADQMSSISQQAQGQLGTALRQAAETINPSNPALAEQLRNDATGLESANDAQAAQALEDVASIIEALGRGQMGETSAGTEPGEATTESGQGLGGGSGNGTLPGEQRPQPSADLDVEGVPLELTTSNDGTTPTNGETDANAISSDDQDDFTQGEVPLSTDPVQAADDPLSIPADLRDVVQDYFSP